MGNYRLGFHDSQNTSSTSEPPQHRLHRRGTGFSRPHGIDGGGTGGHDVKGGFYFYRLMTSVARGSFRIESLTKLMSIDSYLSTRALAMSSIHSKREQKAQKHVAKARYSLSSL
jgi:hypothetical protein